MIDIPYTELVPSGCKPTYVWAPLSVVSSFLGTPMFKQSTRCLVFSNPIVSYRDPHFWETPSWYPRFAAWFALDAYMKDPLNGVFVATIWCPQWWSCFTHEEGKKGFRRRCRILQTLSPSFNQGFWMFLGPREGASIRAPFGSMIEAHGEEVNS